MGKTLVHAIRIMERAAWLRSTPPPVENAAAVTDANFLLDRLADFENDLGDDESTTRQWFGHVVPAIARFRETISATPSPVEDAPVEADETYIGRWRRKGEKERGFDHKMKVLTLIDRATGKARSTVLTHVNSKTVGEVVAANVSREARLMTDEASVYRQVGKTLASHESINHKQEEYARGDVTTNRAEGYFSVFKKGMRGVYQHCQEKHLHRYLAEFDFRYSHRIKMGVNDHARAELALKGAKGKRMYYKQPV